MTRSAHPDDDVVDPAPARLRDPGARSASTVRAMATEGGARAFAFDRVGRLAPGWSADVRVVDAPMTTPLTSHDLAEPLVLRRGRPDVRAVMVTGERQVPEGEVLDADLGSMSTRVAEQAERLWRT